MIETVILLAMPFLTALALATLRSEPLGASIDRWVTTLALPSAIALAGWGQALAGLGLLTAVLVWFIAALDRWSASPTSDEAPSAATRAMDQVLLGGLLLVACAPAGIPLWGALTVTVAAASGRPRPRRIAPETPVLPTALLPPMGDDPATPPPTPPPTPAPLGLPRDQGLVLRNPAILAASMLLVLFGVLTAGLEPMLAGGCRIIGLAAILVLVPALLPVSLLLLLRLAGPQASGLPPADTLATMLLAAGVAGLLACSALPLLRLLPAQRTMVLAQIALAAAAIGLGDGVFGAVILLVLLTLSDAAARVAPLSGPVGSNPGGPITLLALAGVPPFGTFAGLALVLPLMAQRSPWLLLACLPGLALPAWPLIRQAAHRLRRHRPATPSSITPSLAWLPLVLTLILGFLLPDSLTAALRAIVATAP